MCVACAAGAGPEVVATVGGYVAFRALRRVRWVRGLIARLRRRTAEPALVKKGGTR